MLSVHPFQLLFILQMSTYPFYLWHTSMSELCMLYAHTMVRLLVSTKGYMILSSFIRPIPIVLMQSTLEISLSCMICLDKLFTYENLVPKSDSEIVENIDIR